jgi:hypothetical protein
MMARRSAPKELVLDACAFMLLQDLSLRRHHVGATSLAHVPWR